MYGLFTAFLDQFVRRIAALVVGMVSSRVEGLQAAVQADHQSQLEDLARKYEADGKMEIAANLRKRAARMTSSDLASEATEIFECLSADSPTAPESPVALTSNGTPALADFRPSKPTTKKRRKKADTGRDSDETGAGT